MSENTTIKVMIPNKNPWSQGHFVEVSREAATKIAAVAARVAEDLRQKKFDTAWKYDSYVFSSIKDLLPKDPVESEGMFRAVEKILSENMNRKDWYDGNYAAYRCLSTRNAYATPTYLESLRNSIPS